MQVASIKELHTLLSQMPQPSTSLLPAWCIPLWDLQRCVTLQMSPVLLIFQTANVEKNSSSWTNSWPAYIQAEEKGLWQKVPFHHQSQEHSSDTEGRRILTGCDAREMVGVYLQLDWEFLAEYGDQKCWSLLNCQMEKLRQVAPSMPHGLCSQNIDPIPTDRR